MKLIDADELKETLKTPIPMDSEKAERIWEGWHECTIAVDRAIDAMPTIEERKKGKWIPHPNKELREWDVCTACGTGCKRREYGTNPDGTEYITEFSYLYCPNCGADMREET